MLLKQTGDNKQSRGSACICEARAGILAPKTVAKPRVLKKQKTTDISVVLFLEQVMGIEPTNSAWEADVMPLNYTCKRSTYIIQCFLKKASGLPPGKEAGQMFFQKDRIFQKSHAIIKSNAKRCKMEWVTAIKETLKYIENNLLTVKGAEEAAKNVAMSPFYLQQGFQMLTGFTVSDYVKKKAVVSGRARACPRRYKRHRRCLQIRLSDAGKFLQGVFEVSRRDAVGSKEGESGS